MTGAPFLYERLAETLVAAYQRAGYRLVAPAILQPAEPFLDLSGEDIRKSLYLTTDLSGEELSVRVVPKQADEFTCSSCFLVHHRSRLASEKNGEMICTDCAA